ncbi:MAG: hypothetical protein ACLFP8_00530 [Alphaproteobacteria bacterium]
MVDSISSSAGQIGAALAGVKGAEPGQEQERSRVGQVKSSGGTDEVLISPEAADLGRVMDLAQDTKATLAREPEITLSSDTGRLNMLV